METYLTSSENMGLVYFASAIGGTLLHFCVALFLWRISWCTVRQLNSPVMKVTGLTAYWVAWVLMIAAWLALNKDPLFNTASMRFGILAGMIIAGVICMMIAIDILLRAYMHKQQDEHHEEVFT